MRQWIEFGERDDDGRGTDLRRVTPEEFARRAAPLPSRAPVTLYGMTTPFPHFMMGTAIIGAQEPAATSRFRPSMRTTGAMTRRWGSSRTPSLVVACRMRRF